MESHSICGFGFFFFFKRWPFFTWASLAVQLVKNLPAHVGDLGLIPGLGRSPGEGNSYPLPYSGLENSIDCKESDTTEQLSLFHLV